MQQDHLHIIQAGDSVARFSLIGAECQAWDVAGRRLTWPGDPKLWNGVAPVLFPVCGWSRDGAIRIDGIRHPMPVHGFAAGATFEVRDRGRETIAFRFCADARTRASYPFDFELDLAYRVTPDGLQATISVENRDIRPMPYACGLHPGFVWRPGEGPHRFVFSQDESGNVPVIAPGGLFGEATRPAPLTGRVINLAPDMFADEAMCFLNVVGRSFSYETPAGTLAINAPDFPHLVLWSRPGGEFLAIESWTGTGDPETFAGDFFTRPSMIHLPPGARRQHRVGYRWTARSGDPRLAESPPRA